MLTLPYPNQPVDGQSLDAVPVNANFTAIAEAIQAFDGSQINAGTVAASALATSINPNTFLHDIIQPFVASGCMWSTLSGLQGTMSSGILYAGTSSAMYRVSLNGVGSYTFTASKDTYIDIDYNGNLYYQVVSNGATSPSITANAIRVAKVVTGASAITSIIQYGLDAVTTSGQLNYIYNTSPFAAPIFTSVNSGTWGGSYLYRNQNGLKEVWGNLASQTISSGGTDYTVILPSNFFNSISSALVSATNLTVTGNQNSSVDTANIAAATGTIVFRVNATTTTTATVSIYIKGF